MPTSILTIGELIPIAGLAGLVLGSFVNLVIDRLPIMLDRRWQHDAITMTGGSPPEVARLDLLAPASHCMSCGTRLSLLELIPLASWLVQRGRCRHCGIAIGRRAPLVEAGLALLFVLAAWHFGPGIPLLAAMGLLGVLVTAAVIDLETRLLPDVLTLPLLWLGLLVNVYGVFTTIDAAVLGAALGYASLWGVNALFRLATGREGMGYGDFKLFAALGACLGWTALPAILILASASGALFGVLALMADRSRKGQPIAFGPWLALAALPVLFDLLPEGMMPP
jgi:leader peptidase (prepilin peptidase)/N-methyltransferase